MAGRITGGGGQWALRIRQLQGLPGRRGRGYCFGYLTRRMSSAAQLRWSLTLVEIATRRQRPAAATRGNKSLARPVSLTASTASGDQRQAASAVFRRRKPTGLSSNRLKMQPARTLADKNRWRHPPLLSFLRRRRARRHRRWRSRSRSGRTARGRRRRGRSRSLRGDRSGRDRQGKCNNFLTAPHAQ